MLATLTSVAFLGLETHEVRVEVDVAERGLPQFILVGLANKSVEEARERVRSAIRNSGYEFPIKKITVNLAPADIPKDGSGFDLPIALGILKASGQISGNIANGLFYGELSLNGDIHPCKGAVLFSIFAKEKRVENIFVPFLNYFEASLIQNLKIFPCKNLSSLIKHINGEEKIGNEEIIQVPVQNSIENEFDLAFIKGQEKAKRALEIIAAGGHNMLMIGTPGSGKTLLAKTLSSIMPKLDQEETIELTKLYSIAGLLSADNPIITSRPFRHPHHSASIPSVIGGGNNPKPGEISLAHRGVLFFDEFLEFPRSILESLREPLEDGKIGVTRTKYRVTFPSRFIFLAACNPCPCGYFGGRDLSKRCSCSASQISTYRKKLSGPILDRIDLQLEVLPVAVDTLAENKFAESSELVRERVEKARNKQHRRFEKLEFKTNGEIPSSKIHNFCKLNDEAVKFLSNASTNLNLSARAYQRVLKVSRTIADLDDAENISKHHLAEAISYRFTDNDNF